VSDVPGILTGNEHLAITPNFNGLGQVNGWVLRHVPTGRALSGYPCESSEGLDRVAARIAHLDWSADAHPYGPEYLAAYSDALQEQEGVEPSPAEQPHRVPFLGGKGLARQALPLMADVLDWWQHLYDQQQTTPVDLPDGTPNREWTHQMMRGVELYGIAYLLGALHRYDEYAADQIAAALSDAWESGDSMGEWVWQWRRELAAGKPPTLPGVPTPAPTELFDSPRPGYTTTTISRPGPRAEHRKE